MKQIQIMDFRGTYKGGGGPDKTILLSAAKHNKASMNVLVTYLRCPNDDEFDIHLKAAKLGINYVDVYDKSFLDLKCLLNVHKLIKEHNISILHSHDDKTLLYGWLLKLFNKHITIMHTCHSHSCYERDDFQSKASYYKNILREKIQIFLMKRYCKPIITVSEDTRNRLINNGILSRDIEVLHNGIDEQNWRRNNGMPALKQEFNVPSDGYIVGTVARITYDKDLPTFYETARLVSKQIKHVIFVIVGDGFGDELARARSEVIKLGLDDIVKFTGHRNDLKNVYTSFDAFLLTSHTEGLPNTVLEAMAMHVPVIATSVGGVSELVIHEKTGYLSCRGDSKNLAKQIVSLLKNEEMRKQFADSSGERIENYFSFDRRVKKMERYYERFEGIS